VTASELVAALRKQYGPPEWAFLEQVGDGTGYAVNRHIDAIAMNLWPSRGLELVGFEVKVSRNDWRRELRNPSKADPVATRCDRFVIVAPVGVVPAMEVPTAWGLIEVSEKGQLRTVHRGEKREDVLPVDRRFTAAVLRRATTDGPTDQLRREIREEVRRDYKRDLDAAVDIATKGASRRLEELQERIRTFEEAAGFSLTDRDLRWTSGQQIGRALRYLVNNGPEGVERQLEQVERTARRILDDVAAGREALAAEELEAVS
jgi:hypothetical protein